MEAKALRSPDAFQRAGGELRDKAIAHGSQLMWGVGGLLLVGLGVAGITYYRQRGEERATASLGQALVTLGRPVGMENSGTEGPAPFESQHAKDEAVELALTELRQKSAG